LKHPKYSNGKTTRTLVLNTETTQVWQRKVQQKTNSDLNTLQYPAVAVVNTTTFSAARDIFNETNDVCCLNFASAKNPGGGFPKGSQAQEESFARASGLYSSLLQAPSYYKANRRSRRPSGLYEDLIIYSTTVPVFRDDNDDLLENPWQTAIITAPAPNRGAVTKNSPEALTLIPETFRRRIDMILSTKHFGHRDLVLGAWVVVYSKMIQMK